MRLTIKGDLQSRAANNRVNTVFCLKNFCTEKYKLEFVELLIFNNHNNSANFKGSFVVLGFRM